VRRPDPVVAAVAALVVAGLLARLIGLGSRPFHWDEARVGYWTLRYADTGQFAHRPAAGGPLVYVLGRWAIGLLGASDAAARLPVAVVGGLFPATALAFRGRLDDGETVALAAVLAAAPPLVYYSRFLRGDLPLAAASLTAVGLAARWRAGDRPRDLYAAAAALGVALAASGLVAVTLALWAAAAALTFDGRRIAGRGTTAPAAVLSGIGRVRARSPVLARAGLLLAAVWAVWYAPRGRVPLSDPIGLIAATFPAPVRAFVGLRWAAREGVAPLPVVGGALGPLVAAAGPVAALALAGFLADRYGVGGDGGRPVVAFAGFWGGLGLFAYPVAAGTAAPWLTVHAVAPLAVPAAVGVGLAARYARRAADRGDTARLAAAVLLLSAAGGHAAAVGLTAYGAGGHAGGPLADAGQPPDDLEPLVGDARAALAAAGGSNARVVYVGASLRPRDESALDAPPIDHPDDRAALARRLPLAWYVARTGAPTASVGAPADLDGSPAVVVAEPEHASALAERLPDHERRELRLSTDGRRLAVFLTT